MDVKCGKFSIGRYVDIRAGDAAVLELLKPTAPYERKKKKLRFKVAERVNDGQKVEYSRPAPWVNKLDFFNSGEESVVT